MVSMKKGLEWGLIAVAFSIVVLPLVVFNGLFFPFITSKAFLFRFLVEIGVIILLLLALWDRNYIPRITPVTALFGVFVVVMLIADLLGANIVRSIWSNFERMEGWITLAHLFGLFIIFERVLFSGGLWKRWIQATLGVSVLVGVHGIVQLAGLAEIHQGGVRLDANFGNAAYLAVYTLFHFFFAAWMFFASRPLWLKGVYGLVGLLNLVLLYYSGTRGALIGLVVGVGVSLLVYAVLSKRAKVIGALIGFALVILMSFGLLVANKDAAWVKDDPVLNRISTISLEEGETRFRIWNIALQGFYERPVLGWGQGNFNLVFSKYYNPELYNQEPWFDRAHNVFFDWLIAGGAVGLIAYLALLGAIGVSFIVGNFSLLEKSIGLGILAAYGTNNLFVFDNLLSYVFFVFLAAWAGSGLLKEYVLPKVNMHKEFVASLIVIVGLFVIYIVNVPALNANGALIRALSPQYAVSERIEFFREALAYNSFASQEIREQMTQVALAAIRQEDLSPQSKAALVYEAAVEMGKQAEVMPESARIHLLYALMLRLLGENELAYEAAGEARMNAPQKETVLWEYALAAEALGKTDEALEVFQYVAELQPNNEQAQEVYAAARERLQNN